MQNLACENLGRGVFSFQPAISKGSLQSPITSLTGRFVTQAVEHSVAVIYYCVTMLRYRGYYLTARTERKIWVAQTTCREGTCTVVGDSH